MPTDTLRSPSQNMVIYERFKASSAFRASHSIEEKPKPQWYTSAFHWLRHFRSTFFGVAKANVDSSLADQPEQFAYTSEPTQTQRSHLHNVAYRMMRSLDDSPGSSQELGQLPEL